MGEIRPGIFCDKARDGTGCVECGYPLGLISHNVLSNPYRYIRFCGV
jgi:hypothetical protein